MMDNTIERRTNNLTHVETMFDARRTPWDGLGKRIAGAVTSRDAIRLAGLDWNVVPTDIISEATGLKIPGYDVMVNTAKVTLPSGDVYTIDRDCTEYTIDTVTGYLSMTWDMP